jgi:integrase
VLLILDTGLRISEARNLRHGDVNADNLILRSSERVRRRKRLPRLIG